MSAQLHAVDLSLRFRPMNEGDVGRVADIEAESHLTPWTAGNFRDALHAGYGTMIAESAGQLVGYGVLMLAPAEAQLLNLTVAPFWRRRGVGRALLRRLIAEARGRGAQQCFLEVRVSNTSAIALYRSESFSSIARRVGYYPAVEGREDALVMRRALDA